MDRRKAIGRIFIIGGGSLAAYSGYKFWDWNKPPDLGYLDLHSGLITALAEAIIPATDSPGAKQAGVGAYIIHMVKVGTERKSQNKFIDGLKALERYSKAQFNRPFEQCTVEEQRQALNHFEERGMPNSGLIGKAENRFFGKSFFATLKTHTIAGYCSSEAGATQGLSYKLIPGKFIGCLPMEPGQKSWATQ